MNILFFIAETSPGGAENQMIDMINEIHSRGLNKNDRYIFAYLREGALHTHLKEDYTVVRIPYRNVKIIRYFVISRALASLIKHEKIDVVYTFLFEANFIAFLARKMTFFRHITSLRTYVDETFAKHSKRNFWIEKILVSVYKGSDTVISNSFSGIRYLQNAYHLSNVSVIPNFISPSKVKQIRSAADHSIKKYTAPIIGTLSRLSSSKNPFRLIDAVALIMLRNDIRPEIHWIGAESDIKASEICDYADQKGVIFRHFAHTHRRFTHLAEFDVAVLFSDVEGISNFLIESMVAGKKIVATDVGDTRSVLDPSTAEIVANDTEAFAEALLKMIHTDISVEQLDRVSREAVLKFGFERTFNEHYRLFQQIQGEQ